MTEPTHHNLYDDDDAVVSGSLMDLLDALDEVPDLTAEQGRLAKAIVGLGNRCHTFFGGDGGVECWIEDESDTWVVAIWQGTNDNVIWLTQGPLDEVVMDVNLYEPSK